MVGKLILMRRFGRLPWELTTWQLPPERPNGAFFVLLAFTGVRTYRPASRLGRHRQSRHAFIMLDRKRGLLRILVDVALALLLSKAASQKQMLLSNQSMNNNELASKQLKESRRQTNAAYLNAFFSSIALIFSVASVVFVSQQVDIARQTNTASNRPWVSAKIKEWSDISYNANGLNLSVSIEIENRGHSPAVSAMVWPEIYTPVPGRDAIVELHEKCDAYGKLKLDVHSFGNTLFP
jgi:hypothetical protein